MAADVQAPYLVHSLGQTYVERKAYGLGPVVAGLQLTPEGRQFHDRAVQVLADLDEAERCVASAAAPRGRVSLNTSVSFGHRVLLPRFLARYPQVTLDIALTEEVTQAVLDAGGNPAPG